MPRKKIHSEISPGENIRAAREKAGLSIDALSKQVGISYSSLCNYEANRRVPTVQMLIDIADATDVSIMYLISDDTEKNVRNDRYITKKDAVSLLKKIKKENRSRVFMNQIDDIIHCINESPDWGKKKIYENTANLV